MKKILIFISAFLLLISTEVKSQYKNSSGSNSDKVTMGLGGGMDYGGFGINLLYYPQRNIGLFAGAGYAMIGLGYNAGLKIRLTVDKKVTAVSPYVLGMYGYNAVIKVSNATELNKMFYGPTFGFGLDLGKSPPRKGYFSLALLVPIRGPEVEEYINDLKDNHNAEIKSGLPPVGISIGYRIVLN